MNILLTFHQGTLRVTLGSGAAARDFQSLLPLELSLRDYAATEKIADLPRRLAIPGEPSGYRPSIGDLCYYAPWGNLALFHKEAPFAPGLVFLGRLEGAVDALARPGVCAANFEPA